MPHAFEVYYGRMLTPARVDALASGLDRVPDHQPITLTPDEKETVRALLRMAQGCDVEATLEAVRLLFSAMRNAR